MRAPILAAALTLALTGCAMNVLVGPDQTIKVGTTTVTVAGLEGYNAFAVQTPDPNAPDVFLLGNNIAVNQEPLLPKHNQGRVVIVWRLDASDSSPYFFPDDDAVKLHAGPSNPLPGDLACGAFGPRKKAFVCAYTRPETPKQWKYTVRVKNRMGPDPTPLDPWVHQN